MLSCVVRVVFNAAAVQLLDAFRDTLFILWVSFYTRTQFHTAAWTSELETSTEWAARSAPAHLARFILVYSIFYRQPLHIAR